VTGLSVTRLLTRPVPCRPRRQRDQGRAEHFQCVRHRLSDPARLAALALIAAFVTDRRYHGIFVAVAIGAEVYWIASQFAVLE
jgi:hypothetical protein